MILTFASRKGGVGKTTSAVSVAAALAETGHRTLLIDADPQASASLSLGVPRPRLAPSLADALERLVPLDELARPTSWPRLELVTASSDLGPLAIEHGYSKPEELRLRQTIERRRRDWDFVVIDPPPGQTLLTRNALAAADAYVIPAVPHFLAVEGIEQLIGIVQRLKRRCHVAPRCFGVLPTMVDRRSRSVCDMLTALGEHFGETLLRTEIPLNTRLAEAPAHGRTIFEHSPRCRGALAYRNAAREILEKMGDRAEAVSRDDRLAASTPLPEAAR